MGSYLFPGSTYVQGKFESCSSHLFASFFMIHINGVKSFEAGEKCGAYYVCLKRDGSKENKKGGYRIALLESADCASFIIYNSSLFFFHL